MAGIVPRWWPAPFVTLLLAAAGALAPVRAQAPGNEAEAKVRFTLTLARFVQWPGGAAPERATLRLCLVHHSPALAAAFAGRQGSAVTGRTLELLGAEAVKSGACDLLFVDASAGGGVAEALAAVANQPVLTLGTADGFVARGGMVELVNVDDALRFDVNLKAVRTARLGLSSQALKLARRVQE
jgi:hypothetical protein